MGWVVDATLRPLNPRERDGTLYRRLDKPQDQSGMVRKILPPTGIQSQDRPACSESPYRLHYPGPPRHGILVWYLSHPTQCVLQRWNISYSIFVLSWLPVTVVMWIHENVSLSSQHTMLISCELKLATWTLSTDRKFQPLWRSFTFCPKWDALLKTPGGGTNRYLLKVPSMLPTAWSTVPKRSSLFTSFALLPFLFSPCASSPPFCPINCHCNPRPPQKGGRGHPAPCGARILGFIITE